MDLQTLRSRRSHKIAFRTAAILAVALFIVTIVSGSRRDRPDVAWTFIAMWAILPPIWFFAEWHFWGKLDPAKFEAGQRYAKDFWLGLGAVAILVATQSLESPAILPTTTGIDWHLVADVLKAFAWPLFGAVALVALRKPLSDFVAALGHRVTKLGAFNVELDLGPLPEAMRWEPPLVDNFRDPDRAFVGDSSHAIFAAIAQTAPADYALADLGEGNEWLTSRLYIMAVMLQRMRRLRHVVFIAGTDKHYAGIVAADAVRWRLAHAFNWLEQAYISAHPPNFDTTSAIGGLKPETAGDLVTNYLLNVRIIPAGDANVVKFGAYSEHASWVDERALATLFGDDLRTDSVERDPDVAPAELTRRVLRRRGVLVAMVDEKKRFLRAIDRQQLLEAAILPQLFDA